MTVPDIAIALLLPLPLLVVPPLPITTLIAVPGNKPLGTAAAPTATPPPPPPSLFPILPAPPPPTTK
jgi:hypothetical protein